MFLEHQLTDSLLNFNWCNFTPVSHNSFVLNSHYSIRSIVCLNLPSFSGGFNPWGTPNSKKVRDVNSHISRLFEIFIVLRRKTYHKIQMTNTCVNYDFIERFNSAVC